MAQGAVPPPASNLGLILGASSSFADSQEQRLLQQQRQQQLLADQQRQEQEANRPVHPLMQQFIQRVMAGEDPVALGNEARNHPEFANFVSQVTQSAGRPGGSRNQFDPGPSSPPSAQNSPPSASLGGSPAAPTPALGSAPMAAPAQGPTTSLGNVDSQPNAAPAQRPPMAAPQQPITARDLQQMQGVLPAAAAAQGRQQLVQQQNELKRELAAQNLLFQMEKLDANTRMEVMKLLSGEKKVGMQTETQRDVANTRAAATRDAAATAARTQKQVADTNAAARSSAAAARAASGKAPEDMERKELNAELQQQLKTIERLSAVSDFDKQPGLVDEVAAAKARVQELRSALGRPVGAVNPPKSMQPRATFPTQQVSPAQSPTPAAPAAQGGKIRVKLKDGRTGKIDPKDFNPATMERL